MNTLIEFAHDFPIIVDTQHCQFYIQIYVLVFLCFCWGLLASRGNTVFTIFDQINAALVSKILFNY